MAKKCMVDGCDRKHFGKGMCRLHYDRHRRNLKPSDKGYKKCSVEHCIKNVTYPKFGLCDRHYKQMGLYGETIKNGYDRNTIVIHSNYAEIVLENELGEEVARTKVDKATLETLKMHRWSLKDGRYARYRDKATGKSILMQRLLMNVVDNPNVQISYRNQDTLDNRMNNLYVANREDISRTTKTSKSNTSGYKGVSQYKNGKYRAYIKGKHLGTFDTAIDAYKARTKAEEKVYASTLKKLEKVD